MTEIMTYIVDSFTDVAFKGNPAGVCIVESALEDEMMLTIAMELGLSETAFIQKKDNHFSIRYFSPKQEIPLCGHATLAASKVLFSRNVELENILFINKDNLELPINKKERQIQMEFPIYTTSPANVNNELLHALGLNSIEDCVYNNETNIILLRISNVSVLRNLNPDFEALVKSNSQINGVLVTAKSQEDKFDFESRYFWPWSGTNEDPVTGGTHTFLAAYWSKILEKKTLESFQCSERSGSMTIELINDEKMYIRSNAVIVFEGMLKI